MGYNEETTVRQLLELYFEGETTLEQERSLKEYFSGGDVPADLEYARAMFGFFGRAAEDTAHDGIVLPDMVCSQGKQEAEDAGAVISAAGPGMQELPRRRRFRMLYATVSVAAMLLVALGVAFLIDGRPDGAEQDMTVYCYVDGQPVTDIEFAARQMQMAARILEGNLKTSAESMRVVSQAGKPISELGIVAEPGEEMDEDEYETYETE